ncbi:MAG: DUF4097 family beta strand repeat-containing protein [Bacteroidota bacterium]
METQKPTGSTPQLRRWALLVLFAAVTAAFVAIMIAFSRIDVSETSWSIFNQIDKRKPKQEQRVERKFPFHAGNELQVTTDVGDIVIQTEGRDTASIIVELRGTLNELSNFNLDFSASDRGLKITGKSISDFDKLLPKNFHILYRIKIPKEAFIDIETSGGDVLIGDVDGTVKCITSGGDIDVGTVTKGARLHTSGGNIRIKGAAGPSTIETSGGDVHVDQSFGTARIETSGGDISINEANGILSATTSGGDLRIGVGTSVKELKAETSGGNITVSIPPTINATIDAQSISGSVESDLPITAKGKVSEGALRGTLNRGGAEITLRTSGGTIQLHAAGHEKGNN